VPVPVPLGVATKRETQGKRQNTILKVYDLFLVLSLEQIKQFSSMFLMLQKHRFMSIRKRFSKKQST